MVRRAQVLGFFISLPVMVALEGHQFGKFTTMFTENAVLSKNLLLSGLTFYLYNELATMTIKKTSAVTASVANTAKRVIVMLVSAVVFGEDLTVEKKVRPHPLARVPHPSLRRPLRARGRYPPHPPRVTPLSLIHI